MHPKGDVDGRSASARRFRDLMRGFLRDLGDEPDEADKALARQAAALTLQAEALQAKVAAGADVDPDALVRVTNALARAVLALRTRAKPKGDAAPSLADYLAANYPTPAPGEAASDHVDVADAAESAA